MRADQLLRELRQRRAPGRAETPAWERLARLEVGILVAGYVVFGFWLLVGGPPIGGRSLELLRERGPAGMGLAAAIVVGLSLSSGLRGAPWVFSRADVQHVFLAPVERVEVRPFPLREANEALRRLRAGELRGAAVLVADD